MKTLACVIGLVSVTALYPYPHRVNTMQTVQSWMGTAAALQGPPMPPPGNPNHDEPAPGAFCHMAGETPDPGHDCACEKKCVSGTDADGHDDGTLVEVEDNVRCRAACHKRHCNCQTACP